jgi:hypothetical protein
MQRNGSVLISPDLCLLQARRNDGTSDQQLLEDLFRRWVCCYLGETEGASYVALAHEIKFDMGIRGVVESLLECHELLVDVLRVTR